MVNSHIKVIFHNGPDDFNRIITELILRKLTYYSSKNTNDGIERYNDNNHTTTIYHIKQR